jgi:hypothetical protein
MNVWLYAFVCIPDGCSHERTIDLADVGHCSCWDEVRVLEGLGAIALFGRRLDPRCRTSKHGHLSDSFLPFLPFLSIDNNSIVFSFLFLSLCFRDC